MLRTIGLSVLLLAIAPLAQGADNGIYLGAGYAQSDYGLSNPLDAPGFDDEDDGFKLIAGFRALDSFGVELNYTDHGDATVDPLTLSAETIAGYAVGFLDFPVIDLFAKVGAASWQVDGRAGPCAADGCFDESDFDFAWGAGVQAHFWSLAARLEYEQFKILDEDLGTISLSFIYTFF